MARGSGLGKDCRQQAAVGTTCGIALLSLQGGQTGDGVNDDAFGWNEFMFTRSPGLPIDCLPPTIHDVACDDGGRDRAAKSAAVKGSVAALRTAFGGVVSPDQIRIEKGKVGRSADLQCGQAAG